MRQKIFEVIEPSNKRNVLSTIYDYFMIFTIFMSILPLVFKETYAFFYTIDTVCMIIFIIDYVMRWFTADFKYNKKSVTSFLKYPFGFLAIVDLISILPSFVAISSGLKLFRIFRMVRAFRVFKMFRYSKSVRIIMSVLQRSKGSLIAVCTLALAYIIVSALVVFNVEPDSFDTFFDAVYWATVSLTTVGYGDIYPVTTTGRIVTMFSSLFGVAVVALPAGIITAGYMSEINNDSNKGE